MRLKGHICNEDVDIGDLLAGCFYGSESKKLSQILAKALEKVCGVLAITTGRNKLDRDRMKEEQSKIERRMSWEDKEEINKNQERGIWTTREIQKMWNGIQRE